MKRIMVNWARTMIVFLGLVRQLVTASGQEPDFSLLGTITNPAPNITVFGWSVAALGSDRILVGAVNYLPGSPTSGAAYLFESSGALLATFTNPAPAQSDGFGDSVAALGADRVLIGAGADDRDATDAGSAYLFRADGTLLTTFTNPSPSASDFFGHPVTAVGVDCVLIGAFNAFEGSGAAYLFNTNGTLLTTFTNPVPNNSNSFGISLAALGADRVIIGAGYDINGTVSGAAYLFSTNGNLLTTFTNPTPAAGDEFGFSVATVGADRVIVGARFDDTSAIDAGAAYLFNTNGTLLTSYVNPTPTRAFFGTSVAGMGKDYVLVGGPAGVVGVVYCFDLNGTLLTSITNSAKDSDWFGNSVTAVGHDQVLIGAPFSQLGGLRVGAAYLFRIPSAPAPSLSIRLTAVNSVVISWPSPSTGWTLQENTNSVSSVNWSNAPGPIQDDGTNKMLIVNPPTGNRFYRLFKP